MYVNSAVEKFLLCDVCQAGAAKAANEAMSRHLANEWGRYNVRLNNVAPV